MDCPDDQESIQGTCDWPHSPPHRLAASGVFFVTARRLKQVRHFYSTERLDFVRDKLLAFALHYGWKLEAWAILANHYHFVAHSPEPERSAESLGRSLRHFHGDITRFINRADGVEGRALWRYYREAHLTLQRGYLARLNYTHNNAVHHRLVGRARDYEWCWRMRLRTPAPRLG